MTWFNDVLAQVIGVLWSVPTFVTLLGVGILFSIWTKFIQIRALTHGLRLVRGYYDDKSDPGAINHFQALSTALSGTVGLGNIGGVALAITAGGPGALFWMWMTGFFGMAIKAVEVTLAMMYRDTSDPDNPRGGAMWVIRRGLGDRHGGWMKPVSAVLGALFCVTLLLATITGGNMFQAWNVADITHAYFNVPPVATGLIMATLTGLVIIGGIKRIGDVTGFLVPVMCGVYLIAGMFVLAVEAANVPALLWSVVRGAFSPAEAEGAFLGASAWFALTTGLRRALFSNEAGQGSSPIAHSAAKTDEPAREGIVAALEPFIDTCLVCTLTALVILATDTWRRPAVGPISGEVRVGPTVNTPSSPEPALHWRVYGADDISVLPPRESGETWHAGQRIFLLAQIPGDTSRRRTKIEGSLAPADTPEAPLRIHWPDVPPGMQLVDHGVYLDYTASALTGQAFDRAVPGLGKWLVTLTCWLFALATMISWSYYGEAAVVYLVGQRGVIPYQFAFCALGVVATLPNFIRNDEHLANLADLGSGCMLFSNAPIILLLSHRAIAVLADYFRRFDAGEMQPAHRAPPVLDVMDGNDVL